MTNFDTFGKYEDYLCNIEFNAYSWTSFQIFTDFFSHFSLSSKVKKLCTYQITNFNRILLLTLI